MPFFHTDIRRLLLTFALWLVVTWLVVAGHAFAGHAFAGDESTVRTVAQTATSATVSLQATGEFSSGVVISATGDVLTVNHGLPAETQMITVTDAFQNQYQATVVERDAERDLAILKITGNDFPKNYVVAAALPPQDRQVVLASGYPSHDSNRKPALIRIGRITRHNQEVIRTSCALTAGDSGGGLFDLNGRLIGINQRIGSSRSANVHARTDVVYRIFSVRQPPAAEPTSKTRPGKTLPSKTLPGKTIFVSSLKAREAWLSRTLEVFDTSDRPPGAAGPEPLCHAVLWDSGRAFTKLSELGTRQQVIVRKSGTSASILAKVTRKDLATDLAVLEFPTVQVGPDAPEPAESRLHELVVTGKNADQAAIIGRQKTTVPSAKSVLGCTLSEANGGIRIDSILPNSAAAKAGLQVADRVIRINRQLISGFDVIENQLQSVQPGNWSVFEIKRGIATTTCDVRMKHDSGMMLERVQHLDGAAGALSHRRTGFRNVIQHDADLKPSDMGSPLLSLDGQLLGINIAVQSREAVIAIPVDTLKRLLP